MKIKDYMDDEIKTFKTKEEARGYVVEFQAWQNDKNLFYEELIIFENQLYKIAKRFGLIREFKENGIL